ncbi:MAG: DUF1294 domain-containing protein [Actinobacteria bacterium HGW-Actinobacteria-1]|jgi:uncharacterized membrane protein YsdA (DUF1294 family)/cold shock CspA family protein|nr:MAG: DUF1294 domain-containing protein [Actinobacteria bacterium HGW-Actinobacteria-1]
MTQQGRLTEWNDDRGFGFIEPLGGGPRVFAHVSEFPRDKRRPEPLDLVTYDVSHDERGRLRASRVRFLTPTSARNVHYQKHESGKPQGVLGAVAVAAAFLVLLALVAPSLVFGIYAGASALLFAIYYIDKTEAQRGGERVPENMLHLFAVLGGWPGALIARHLFRHKTRKQPFRTIFWGTVAMNCAGLVYVVFALRA